MTLEAESNIAGLESMIRFLTIMFLHGHTLRLTKSLVHFQIQIQNFVLSKFEKLEFGAPKTK